METTNTQYAAGNSSTENIRQRPTREGSVLTALRSLQADATMLVKQEIALAKTETEEKAKKLIRNIIYLFVGALVAFVGIIELVSGISTGIYWAFVEAGMDVEVASWLAPILVGLGIFAIGAGTLAKGAKTIADGDLELERTKESLKEDKEWITRKAS